MVFKINCLITSESIDLKGLSLLINNPRKYLSDDADCYWMEFDCFYETLIRCEFKESREPEILKEYANELIRIYKDSEIIINNVRCKVFNSLSYNDSIKEFKYEIAEGAKLLFKLLYIEAKIRNEN